MQEECQLLRVNKNRTEVNKLAPNMISMHSCKYINKIRQLITLKHMHTHTHTPSTLLDEEHKKGEAVYLSKPSQTPPTNPATTSTPHYALIRLINLGELFN